MLDTAPGPVTTPPPPAMRPGEFVRWAWRQLTTMRTALVLLFLLTLAAIPGSLVPQRSIDPASVAGFARQHRTLTPIFERVWLFDVYSSPWFSAVYLLLLISLVGCVLPRAGQHWAAVRATPPQAPRNLERLPVHERWTTEDPPDLVVQRATRVLRSNRFRVASGAGSVAAERGHSRETGNLVFHLSLVLLLFAVAIGNLLSFKANVLVVEGGGFSNTVTAYDTFNQGGAFDPRRLTPFTVRLKDLAVRFQPSGQQRGAPRDFTARLAYRSSPSAPERTTTLRVNHPLRIEGTNVFLLGNGYAPVFTVRDGKGQVVFSGPVPFLPRDGMLSSVGVVKVPNAEPEQLGFEGFFLPTAVFDTKRGPISQFPDLRRPRAVLTAYTGDLGLGDGRPESVYRLDKAGLTQVQGKNGRPLAQSLAPGSTMRLPDGSSITLDGVKRWASLQISHNPGTTPALLASVLALIGLTLSLFMRRRRVWVRATAGTDGRTLVEVAGLARSEADGREGLAAEVAALAHSIRETR